jgi:hypothetical protein
MSIIVVCPQGHAVTLDERSPRACAYRACACPRCGTVFALDADADPEVLALPPGMAARPEGRKSRDEEDEEDDDRPRKRKPRDDADDEEPPRKRRPPRDEEEEDEDEDEDDDEPVEAVRLTRKQRQFQKVRLGILFHILKLWTYLAALLFGLITMPLLLFIAAFGSGWVATILFQITFNLSMTLAPILGTVGSILCAFAPARSETRGTIIVSVLFDVLAPFFGVLQLIMVIAYWGTLDDRVEKLISYMFYARMACTLVAWWLFQLYLRKLSFYIRESLLASEALNVIVHFLIATIISPTLVILTFVILSIFGHCFVVIMFFVTIGWFVYFTITFPIRQFRFLFQVRSKIYDKFIKLPD